MSKFWNWYDALEKTDPTLRFLIFLVLILFLQGLVPFVVGLVYGTQYILPTTYAGVVVMALFAASKVLRWPK